MKKHLLLLTLFLGTTTLCHISEESYAAWLDTFDKRLRAGRFGQALDNFILLEGAFEYDKHDGKSKKLLVDYLKESGFLDQKDWLSSAYLNEKYNHLKVSLDAGAPLTQAEFALFKSETEKIRRIGGWNRIKIIKKNPGVIRENFLDSVYETSVHDNIETIEDSIEILNSLTAFFNENKHRNPLVVKALQVYAQRRFNNIDELKKALADLLLELHDYLEKNQPKAAAPPPQVTKRFARENFKNNLPEPTIPYSDKQLADFNKQLDAIIHKANAAEKKENFYDLVNLIIPMFDLSINIKLYAKKASATPALGAQLRQLNEKLRRSQKIIKEKVFAEVAKKRARLSELSAKDLAAFKPADFSTLGYKYVLMTVNSIIVLQNYTLALSQYAEAIELALNNLSVPTLQSIFSTYTLINYISSAIKEDFLGATQKFAEEITFRAQHMVDLCNTFSFVLYGMIQQPESSSSGEPYEYNQFLNEKYTYVDYYAALNDSSVKDSPKITRSSSEDDIKKAFRKLAMIHHPDRGGDAERFKKILAAYEILSDAQQRKLYNVRFDQEAKKKDKEKKKDLDDVD